jgi:hypothetical protein
LDRSRWQTRRPHDGTPRAAHPVRVAVRSQPITPYRVSDGRPTGAEVALRRPTPNAGCSESCVVCHVRSSCGPFCSPLRSFCGPNPREHPRIPANTASTTPSVFAAFRWYLRLFADLRQIGAPGSSWLSNAVFRTSATGLQRPYRVAAELNHDSDHPYAMPNVRTGSCRADKINSGAILYVH